MLFLGINLIESCDTAHSKMLQPPFTFLLVYEYWTVCTEYCWVTFQRGDLWKSIAIPLCDITSLKVCCDWLPSFSSGIIISPKMSLEVKLVNLLDVLQKVTELGCFKMWTGKNEAKFSYSRWPYDGSIAVVASCIQSHWEKVSAALNAIWTTVTLLSKWESLDGLHREES